MHTIVKHAWTHISDDSIFPLQFFFFLLIIFAIEVAAGIWGFSNQSKVTFKWKTKLFVKYYSTTLQLLYIEKEVQ